MLIRFIPIPRLRPGFDIAKVSFLAFALITLMNAASPAPVLSAPDTTVKTEKTSFAATPT